MALSDDIDDIQECVSTHDNGRVYMDAWSRLRAKLAESGQPPTNTGMEAIELLTEWWRDNWNKDEVLPSIEFKNRVYAIISRHALSGAQNEKQK